MRTIRDEAFREWEAYATTGDFGASDPARIVFRCLTDPGVRARGLFVDGDKSDAEARVESGSEAELLDLLARSETVD